MSNQIIPMDWIHRETFYPNGYFSHLAKRSRDVGVVFLLISLLFIYLSAFFFFILLSSDDLFSPLFIGLLFLSPGILLICKGIKRIKMGEAGWIKQYIKNSDYPENDIQEFGNQVIKEDTLQLLMTNTKDFLTRDYFATEHCIIKITDIEKAFFVMTSDTIKIMGKIKPVYYTNIAIFSKHNTLILSRTNEQMVKQITDILTERNPAIDTSEGRLIPEEQYFNMIKAMKLKKKQSRN